MKSDYCVYKHTTPNGKVYIGITNQNPLRRWRNGKGYKHNRYFSYAIEKYGWENIKHEILYMNLTKEDAESKEIELISILDSTNRNKGYNLDGGGKHGGHLSQITIEKLRRANIGKKQSAETIKKRVEKLKNPTEETRKKLSIASTGRKHSKETIEKLRKINIGNKNACGCRRSDEHKEILRKLKSKPVIMLSMNGEKMNVFTSLADAQNKTGISKGNICECIHHRRKHAGGYLWSYQIGQEKKEQGDETQ